jgi:hypothetical protein
VDNFDLEIGFVDSLDLEIEKHSEIGFVDNFGLEIGFVDSFDLEIEKHSEIGFVDNFGLEIGFVDSFDLEIEKSVDNKISIYHLKFVELLALSSNLN